MQTTFTAPVLSASEKLHAALQSARSKSLPEYAPEMWRASEKRRAVRA